MTIKRNSISQNCSRVSHSLAAAALYNCALLIMTNSNALAQGAVVDPPVACTSPGPQSPRDITKRDGTNSVAFDKAPAIAEMHLCNIHFHKYAEHRATGYSKQAVEGDHKGFVCDGKVPAKEADHGPKGKVVTKAAEHVSAPVINDTIEVHWVFTTCKVKPGPTLASCPTNCEPGKVGKLRVEARTFYLTKDGAVGDFPFYKDGKVALPAAAAGAVEYLGSTTGEKFNELQKYDSGKKACGAPGTPNACCSPAHVTWHVSPGCTALNIESLKNLKEDPQGHGVRQLIEEKKFLSKIDSK